MQYVMMVIGPQRFVVILRTFVVMEMRQRDES